MAFSIVAQKPGKPGKPGKPNIFIVLVGISQKHKGIYKELEQRDS